MIRWIFSALFLIGLCAPAVSDDTPAGPPADVPAPTPKTLPTPTTPIVELGDASGPHCTGFFVEPDFIVSAGHCYFGTSIADGDFRVLPTGEPLPKGKDDPGGLLVIMPAAMSNPIAGLEDWSIFLITDMLPPKWAGVKLDCHYTPMDGAEVYARGFPVANGRLTLMRGYINGIESPFDARGEGVIPITMPVSGGASGSPVFEPDGRVIGIIVDENQEQAGWSYFSPITPVCNALHLTDGGQ